MNRLANRILGRFGYELRKKSNDKGGAGFNSSYLSRLCAARTVVDVGVGFGTFPLYDAFPQAKLLLVEPLRDYERAISEFASRYDCEVHYKAVSNAPGVREMQVDTKNPLLSSFAERTPLTASGNEIVRRLVEVTTLDEIVRNTAPLLSPIVLKIDTEGHELEVLEGARSLLGATDFVIAEASIAPRFERSYEFEDLVLFMKQNGFCLFSILNVAQPRHELRPRYADVVFKRRTAIVP